MSTQLAQARQRVAAVTESSTLGRAPVDFLHQIQASMRLSLAALLLVMLTEGSFAQSPASLDRKPFPNSIVSSYTFFTPSHAAEAFPEVVSAQKKKRVPLRFGLDTENVGTLEKLVESGRTISPAELNAQYSGDKEAYERLLNWLKSQGFTIDATTADRSAIYATGTVQQIEDSLQVKMGEVTIQGTTYPAARGVPSLPKDVAANVGGIEGLQPFLRANKHGRVQWQDPTSSNSAAFVKLPGTPPYYPSELLKAYGHTATELSGKGQTIAILIDALPDSSDLQAFWQKTGAKGDLTRIKLINVKKAALPAPSGEETLDVQWASGIAPGADIRVYAAGSLRWVDLDRALDQMMEDFPSVPSMRQISISLGLGETYMSQDEIRLETTRFARMAALGINVFVSTGDAGSHPDDTGHSSSGPLQVEYQASDPFVVAVGGTSIQLEGPSGMRKKEIGWDGSGGGVSQKFPLPTWQASVNLPTNNWRMTPDVSSVGDPDTGAYIVLQGRGQQTGGTSWGAPTWAGICALLNEARAKVGKPTLGFLNPIIYSPSFRQAFFNISEGSNGPDGRYDAGQLYNLVTGLGVPRLDVLRDKLVAH